MINDWWCESGLFCNLPGRITVSTDLLGCMVTHGFHDTARGLESCSSVKARTEQDSGWPLGPGDVRRPMWNRLTNDDIVVL